MRSTAEAPGVPLQVGCTDCPQAGPFRRKYAEKLGIDPSGNETKARLQERLGKKRDSETSADGSLAPLVGCSSSRNEVSKNMNFQNHRDQHGRTEDIMGVQVLV